jgi:predicted MFS family arabinose efflux permease
MHLRRLKPGFFILEGLNSFGTVYYFYYFYFFMKTAFGVGDKTNLALAALNGAAYAIGAWFGGRFAQRFGYFTALKLGFGLMAGSMCVGLTLASKTGQVLVMVSTVAGMCFTWPTLEALVSEGEDRAGLQWMVGFYNVVWATTAAIGNFAGGAMFQKLGHRSLFYVPAAIQVAQFGLTLWLEAQVRRSASMPLAPHSVRSEEKPDGSDLRAPAVSVGGVKARSFQRMAWLANPCAYVAINTLIAATPGVAARLGLSAMQAGFCCSVWCFARVGAFMVLWFWNGWHYRFRWLLAAYLALVGGFTAILTAPSLAAVVVAQVIFGGAIGLVYYSSLFYSMDSSETKGEHGGIHEAVIGLGNFAGPAVGAASLWLLPTYANSGAWAVSGLLALGLPGLVGIWRVGGGRTEAEVAKEKLSVLVEKDGE